MRNSPIKNASGEAGVQVAGGGAKATKQNRLRWSGTHSINKVVQEIQRARLQLRSTAVDIQHETLPKVVQHRGALYLSTYEEVAADFLCIAPSIKELKETLGIIFRRDNAISPSGPCFKGVVLYVLIEKRGDLPRGQQFFAKEEV